MGLKFHCKINTEVLPGVRGRKKMTPRALGNQFPYEVVVTLRRRGLGNVVSGGS